MKNITLLLALNIFFNINIWAQFRLVSVTNTMVKIAGKSEKKLYFAFDKGDKISLDLTFEKGRKLKQVDFYEYPDIHLTSDYKIKRNFIKHIKIKERGIYVFKFINRSIFPKILKINLDRVPGEGSSKDFNTTVYWQTQNDTIFNYIDKEIEVKKYDIKTVVPLTSFYINSGSNATLLGGKSRISIPLSLPENAIKCYYQFSAAKNKSEIGKLSNLTKQLSGIFADTKSIDINTDDLQEPYGRTYCDVYLLDERNSHLFERKKAYQYIPEGSRRNAKAGIVEIPLNREEKNLYIGFKNPLKIQGIHINFEASAIVETTEKVHKKLKDMDNYKVIVKKTPYIKTQKDSEQ